MDNTIFYNQVKSDIGETLWNLITNSLFGMPMELTEFPNASSTKYKWEVVNENVISSLFYKPSTMEWKGEIHDYNKGENPNLLVSCASDVELFVKVVQANNKCIKYAVYIGECWGSHKRVLVSASTNKEKEEKLKNALIYCIKNSYVYSNTEPWSTIKDEDFSKMIIHKAHITFNDTTLNIPFHVDVLTELEEN